MREYKFIIAFFIFCATWIIRGRRLMSKGLGVIGITCDQKHGYPFGGMLCQKEKALDGLGPDEVGRFSPGVRVRAIFYPFITRYKTVQITIPKEYKRKDYFISYGL